MSALEHEAMFREDVCVDFDITAFEVEVAFFRTMAVFDQMWQLSQNSKLKIERKKHFRSKET